MRHAEFITSGNVAEKLLTANYKANVMDVHGFVDPHQIDQIIQLVLGIRWSAPKATATARFVCCME